MNPDLMLPGQKGSSRKFYIFLGIIVLLIVLRYSYFVFTRSVTSLPEVSKKELPAQLKQDLAVPDAETEGDRDEKYISLNVDTTQKLPYLKINKSEDGPGYAYIVTLYSSEFKWTRKFSDYYFGGFLLASSPEYLVVELHRESDVDLEDYLNVMHGYSGPPPMVYFFYNMAKARVNDILVLERKTGKTIKRYRADNSISRTKYSAADRSFYFEFGKRGPYRRLELP